MTTESSRRLPRAASRVPVSEAMARPVVTVAHDMDLLALLRLFVTAGIGGAPVLDASGKPIGVVSKTDLLREIYDQSDMVPRDGIDASALESTSEAGAERAKGSACRAIDIMTGSPVVVTESTSLAQAAARMAEEHLHRVFVVDAGGSITGVLSSSDVVHWLASDDVDDVSQ